MLDEVNQRARLFARSVRDGTRPVPVAGRAVGDSVIARRGRSVLATTMVDRFDAWALRDWCLEVVSSALASAQVAHRTLPSIDGTPHRLVVSSADVARAADALGSVGVTHRLNHARVTWTGRGPARPLTRPPALHARDVVRVFASQVSPAGRLLPTWDLGVDVEVWDQIASPQPSPDGSDLPTGTLVAPRNNPHARTLPPGSLSSPPSDPTVAPLEQVTFPIDVVYTWVDASDPAWQEQLASSRDDDATSHASARSASRFTNRDELRYSLRSIAAYASWVRRIHIVTNGQVPEWLALDHPQVRVVRHDEIFPEASDLPTFNSHAIEANLHRIPGLAQHYLYFNDDVFLARPLRPEHFFTANGLLRYFPSLVPVDPGRASAAADLPIISAFKNGRAIIEDRFGRRPMTRPRHTPHPQRGDVLRDIDSACPDEIRHTSAARFRSPGDVSVASQLQAYWAAATGRGVPAETRYEFIDVGDPGIDRRIASMLVRADLDCYCLNETDTPEPAVAEERVRRVLTSLLPFTSPYER